MDAARTINKLGARRVTVIYRRAREQMPAEAKEVDEAIEEGVEFLFQNNITKIIGKDKVEAVECIKTELVKVEGDRERPVNIEGSNYIFDVDYVVMALGSKPNKQVLEKLGLKLNDWGCIDTDENGETSMENIFAAGEIAGNRRYCRQGCQSRKRRGRIFIQRDGAFVLTKTPFLCLCLYDIYLKLQHPIGDEEYIFFFFIYVFCYN